MAEENDPIEQAEEPKAEPQPQGGGVDWKAEARKWESRAKENRDAQKAAEEALAAKSDYDSIKAELDAAVAERDKLRAEKEHANAVVEAAKAHGVDAELLARMSGDVESNAEYLASMPKYKPVHDGGEAKTEPVTRESIEAIADPVERVRMRAGHQELYR